jgi:hypothetical protein
MRVAGGGLKENKVATLGLSISARANSVSARIVRDERNVESVFLKRDIRDIREVTNA